MTPRVMETCEVVEGKYTERREDCSRTTGTSATSRGHCQELEWGYLKLGARGGRYGHVRAEVPEDSHCRRLCASSSARERG